MTEQIFRQLFFRASGPTLRLADEKNRAAYEKAREYFSSLLDRETDAKTVQVFQSIGRLAIRTDEAGRFARVRANSSLLPQEPEPPEHLT